MLQEANGAKKNDPLMRTSISIPRSMIKEIDQMAAKEDRSRSNQVLILLKKAMKRAPTS